MIQALRSRESCPPAGVATGPGHVRLLSGLGAWLAAAFLVGAIAALIPWLAESTLACAMLGAAACGLSAWRVRSGTAGPFLAQFLTAISLAGAALIVWAGLELPGDIQVVLLLAAVLATGVLLANPEPVSRLLMALAAVGCAAGAAYVAHLLPLACIACASACSLLWLKQADWTAAGWRLVLEPLGYSLALALALLPAALPAAGEATGGFGAGPPWLVSAGISAVLAATVLLLGRRLSEVDAAALPGGHILSAASLASVAVLAAALAAGAWRAPGLPACLLLWVLGMATGRRVMVWLAFAGTASYLFQLYYRLDFTLLGKGLALILTALVLLVLRLVLARPARPRKARATIQRSSPPRTWAILLLLGFALVFGVFNWSVQQKEGVLREGRVVHLALAPVDPRAFMTGDYMALNYEIAQQAAEQAAKESGSRSRDGFAIVSPDGAGIARLVRLQAQAAPLAGNEMALLLRMRKGRVQIGTDAFYFEEGTARRYERARFGEFRLSKSGELLLVRLLGESLTPLSPD